jgi:cytoplasmic polyadenylation element-binding protein
MDDSPLVNHHQNNKNNHHINTSGRITNNNNNKQNNTSNDNTPTRINNNGSTPTTTTTTMREKSTNTIIQDDSNSTVAPGFLPKSNSCLSVSTTSTSISSGSSSCASSTASTSPVSTGQQQKQHQQQSNSLKLDKNECSCGSGDNNNGLSFQQPIYNRHNQRHSVHHEILSSSSSSSSTTSSSSSILDQLLSIKTDGSTSSSTTSTSPTLTTTQCDSSSSLASICLTNNHSSMNNSLLIAAAAAAASNNNIINHLLTSTTTTGTAPINTAIESAAKKYRCAAQVSEATCCWKGKLPPKQYKAPVLYSTKVFVGGLPWDITEEDILKEFGVFGPCRVEWTNKERYQQQQQQINNNDGSFYNNRRSMGSNLPNNNNKMTNTQQQQSNDSFNSSKHRLSPGFAYVIYDNEYSVRSLVGNCIEDYQNGRDRVEFYFKISTRRVRNKEVQIIPWILADNNFALCTPKELDPKKTVFVGNLHGTMTARDLAHIMNELFGCVVYAGIDIDKLKYPIGSGRVTFSHQQNFMRAVRAAFVDIQAAKFCKRIQIDPYLEDVHCCTCMSEKGIYFCRDFQCFNYYCGGCWEKQHSYSQLGNHKPLMRKREDKQF